MIVDELRRPIVLAPLGGGPSTPELAAAVSGAGGLGFLAAGYLSVDELRNRIRRTRELTSAPFGVNVFVPGDPAPGDSVLPYAESLASEAASTGVQLGQPRFDDDGWAAKLDLLSADPVPVVSFTFGCPDPEVIGRLRGRGSEVWVTVTTVAEARRAAGVGCTGLVVQGVEAGGHRASFTDPEQGEGIPDGLGLMSLLAQVTAQLQLPLIATGGIATGAGVAAVIAAGASAAALGSAFLLCPEAGTAQVHRRALSGGGQTALTRAFTGRLARGISNRFMEKHSANAPTAYPEVHYLTAPLRQHGRDSDNADLVNLWAGQSFELARSLPAAQLVEILHEQARLSAERTSRCLS